MSNRTLLEINHDLAGEIARNPERFLSALLRLLASGQPNDGLVQFGVSVGPTRHHSEPEPFTPRKPEDRP